MRTVWRTFGTLTLTFTLLGAGCIEADTEPVGDEEDVGSIEQAATGDPERGRDIWFENTYGGEKFFTFLANHPDPAERINIGFEAVANTPRSVRFDVWGVVNDPGCEANPAGGMDICDDPNASGIVGIRRFPGPGGTTMFGVACAGCHAGFDPNNPPEDPNDPSWDNVHATIGNSYIKIGKIFAANLDPTDPRGLVFASWPDGTVDTTALFSDNINNPGVITAFWEWDDRNRFHVGLAEPQLRNGQGGEDDLGDLAAVRVYTNIGACFFECTAPAVATGTELDIAACKQNCPDYPPQQDLDDLVAFLSTFEAPQYPGHVYLPFLYYFGKHTFNETCEGCHDRTGDLREVLSDDAVNALHTDPANNTNECRARTTNWLAGNIWGQFSSQLYKDRHAAGDFGYRNMPLAGVWSTTPFMHNQSIGSYAPANATPQERVGYFWDSMFELLQAEREPVINTIPVPVGPFPAGTPLGLVVNRDPATGELLCGDVVENKGHHYGAELPTWQKIALIYFLQFQ